VIFFRVPTRHLTFCVVNREKFLLRKLLSIFHHNESAISESFVKNCGRELSRYICGKTRKWIRCWGWNQTAEMYSYYSTRFMTLAVTLTTQTLNVRFYIDIKISVSTVWPSVCRQKTILDQLCTNISWCLFNGAFYGNLSWRKKTRYTASLSTTDPTWNGLGSNWGIYHRSPLTNCSDHRADHSYYP